MAIKTAIELEVKQPSLKGFRQELQQAKKDAEAAVITFGEFSPEAVKATEKVAQLQAQMGDFNNRVAAVNPDKFAQLNTVVSSVANGFQAAQGAMVLLGGTTQNVEKTFVKLQAAMALSQGLEGLGKTQQQMKQLIASATTLQKAMVGVAGVVGLVAANFDTLVKFIPGLQKVGDILKEVGYTISDFFGLGFREKAQFKEFKRLNEEQLIEIQKNIDILSLQDKKEREIFDEKEKLIKARLDAVNQAIALEQYADEEGKQELLLQQKQFNADLEVLDAERLAYETKRQKEFEALKKAHATELEKIELNNKNKIKDIDERFWKSEDKRQDEQHFINLEKINTQYSERMLQLQQQRDAELKEIGDSALRRQEINDYYNKLERDAEIQQNKMLDSEQNKWNVIKQQNQIKSEEQIKAARLQIAQSTISSLNSLAETFISNQEKLSKVQKGIALVEIGIDTAVAISSLNKESATVSAQMAGVLGPATPLFTAAYYAQGIARILANVAKAKQILSQPNATSGTTGATNNTSFGVTPAPNMGNGSSLPQDVGGGRVYVLEGDISRVQNRMYKNRNVSVVE